MGLSTLNSKDSQSENNVVIYKYLLELLTWSNLSDLTYNLSYFCTDYELLCLYILNK